jgi:hypothetical protein
MHRAVRAKASDIYGASYQRITAANNCGTTVFNRLEYRIVEFDAVERTDSKKKSLPGTWEVVLPNIPSNYLFLATDRLLKTGLTKQLLESMGGIILRTSLFNLGVQVLSGKVRESPLSPPLRTVHETGALTRLKPYFKQFDLVFECSWY